MSQDDEMRRDVKAELRSEAEEMLSEERIRLRKFDYDILKDLRLKRHGGPSRFKIARMDIRRSHARKYSKVPKVDTVTSTGFADARKQQRQMQKKLRVTLRTIPKWSDVPGRITKKTRKSPNRPWLGPYPSYLAPRLIVDLQISELGIILIRAGYFKASEILGLMRRDFYLPLRNFLIRKIEDYVPIDTGDLQKSLRLSVSEPYAEAPPFHSDDLSKGRVFITIASNMPYAGIVTKMNISPPSPYVRHTGKPWEVSRRTGKILNDPRARANFFGTLQRDGRDQAVKQFKIMYSKLDISRKRNDINDFLKMSGYPVMLRARSQLFKFSNGR